MAHTHHAKTVVQPGGRIQFELPELAEGLEVDITVIASSRQKSASQTSIADFLGSLVPSRLSESEWAERDTDFQKDRNEWGR